MATQPEWLSAHEFHRRYDGAKPAFEYWFGKAIRKPMPTNLHGIVQFLIAALLERAGWNTALEVRLKVVAEAEPVPDVVAVRGKFRGPYPTTAPDLCVEILSPRDTLARALDKARRYVSWGSEAVWIIDPEKRTAWMLFQESTAAAEWVPPDGVLRLGDTSIEMRELFNEVDRKIEAAE